MKTTFFTQCRSILLLWLTQALSSLGSAMTNFALVVWSYGQYGSALTTALLTVCAYAPYVLLSIFAGALSDRWDKKRTMLVCDSLAALCTLWVLGLLVAGELKIWHLYLNNALNGLMNTVQQPASEVAVTLLTPREHYQRMGGLQAFSRSLVSLLTPAFATALYTLMGLKAVIFFDLGTFAVAAVCLLCFIPFPPTAEEEKAPEPLFAAAREGLRYLRENRGILDLILFLAVINLTASMFNAALPALALTRPWGGEYALGLVQSVCGMAMLAGSLAASLLPAPKSRVRVICNCLLLAMSTENFCLALGKNLPVWCVGAALGWVGIPVMNANLDVLVRDRVPVELQGRVYAARNTLQFFTIPVGYLLGGLLVDQVFEPLAARLGPESLWALLFGTGKGSGAAGLFLVLGFLGVLTCLIFRRDRHIWGLEDKFTS